MAENNIAPMPPKNKFSEHFRAMADRIERNPEAEFSGAFVVVTASGAEISMLVVDKKKDDASFWGLVQGRVTAEAEVAVKDLQSQFQQGFPGRRG